MLINRKDSLAVWVLSEHYPEDVFTPLSEQEKVDITEALNKCGVKHASDRLHAEWARHLAKLYDYLCDQREKVDD